MEEVPDFSTFDTTELCHQLSDTVNNIVRESEKEAEVSWFIDIKSSHRHSFYFIFGPDITISPYTMPFMKGSLKYGAEIYIGMGTEIWATFKDNAYFWILELLHRIMEIVDVTNYKLSDYGTERTDYKKISVHWNNQ